MPQNYNLTVSFKPKPYNNLDVGNGMHVHLSLQDETGKNIFITLKGNQPQNYFLNSIAGILELLSSSIPFFVINENDFSRFKAKYELPKEKLRYISNTTNAPTNISWGVNNRTTALRIPINHGDPNSYRIEHRVPASDANPYLVLSSVLLGAYHGIINNLLPNEPIWGNAFDPQYKLDSFPLNLQEAKEIFDASILKEYFLTIMNS